MPGGIGRGSGLGGVGRGQRGGPAAQQQQQPGYGHTNGYPQQQQQQFGGGKPAGGPAAQLNDRLLNAIERGPGANRGGGNGGGFGDRQGGGQPQAGGFQSNSNGFGSRSGENQGSGFATASGGGSNGYNNRQQDQRGGGGYHAGDENYAPVDRAEEDADRPERVTYVPVEIRDDELNEFQVVSGIHCDEIYKTQAIVVASETADEKNTLLAIETFDDAHLHPQLMKNIKNMLSDSNGRLHRPLPIQSRAIPLIMNGCDFIGIAQTGSGKTLAFLLPIVNWILTHKMENGGPSERMCPYAVILSPTRELQKQLFLWTRKCTQGTNVSCCEVYGGTAMFNQYQRLEAGCDIITCTAGRLKHLVGDGKIRLDNVQFFVIDEADRMLDDSDSPDVIDMIHNGIPRDHQTLMFSATFESSIQKMAFQRLKPAHYTVSVGEIGRVNRDVKQVIEKLDDRQKRTRLFEILREQQAKGEQEGKVYKTLIFCRTKKFCDTLATFMSQENLPATTIHADRLQEQRESALRAFNSGKQPHLLCTDLCARGLDIPGVDHVINYEMPDQIQTYVHRIGRTGRVGNAGLATSFYSESADAQLAAGLVTELAYAETEIPEFLRFAAGYAPSNDRPFANQDSNAFTQNNQTPTSTFVVAPPPPVSLATNGDTDDW